MDEKHTESSNNDLDSLMLPFSKEILRKRSLILAVLFLLSIYGAIAAGKSGLELKNLTDIKSKLEDFLFNEMSYAIDRNVGSFRLELRYVRSNQSWIPFGDVTYMNGHFLFTNAQGRNIMAGKTFMEQSLEALKNPIIQSSLLTDPTTGETLDSIEDIDIEDFKIMFELGFSFTGEEAKDIAKFIFNQENNSVEDLGVYISNGSGLEGMRLIVNINSRKVIDISQNLTIIEADNFGYTESNEAIVENVKSLVKRLLGDSKAEEVNSLIPETTE